MVAYIHLSPWCPAYSPTATYLNSDTPVDLMLQQAYTEAGRRRTFKPKMRFSQTFTAVLTTGALLSAVAKGCVFSCPSSWCGPDPIGVVPFFAFDAYSGSVNATGGELGDRFYKTGCVVDLRSRGITALAPGELHRARLASRRPRTEC